MSADVPDWVHLTDDEELVWTGHPSLRPVAPILAFGVLLILVGIGLTSIAPPAFWYAPLVLVPVGLVIVVRWYLLRWAVKYAITSEEVYKKTGILSRDVTQLRLDRVQNTSFSQSLVERLLSYGDIRVDTAGSGATELVFEDINRPDEVNGIITRQLDEIGGGTGGRGGS